MIAAPRQLDERWPRHITLLTRCGCKKEMYEAGGSRSMLPEIRVPLSTSWYFSLEKGDLPSDVTRVEIFRSRDFVLERVDFDRDYLRYDLLYREKERK
jgi:hypothetical protein